MQENVTVGAGPLLTVKEAAERLKVSTATVYALCESGRLAYVRISTHAIRIATGDLETLRPEPAHAGRAQDACRPAR